MRTLTTIVTSSTDASKYFHKNAANLHMKASVLHSWVAEHPIVSKPVKAKAQKEANFHRAMHGYHLVEAGIESLPYTAKGYAQDALKIRGIYPSDSLDSLKKHANTASKDAKSLTTRYIEGQSID